MYADLLAKFLFNFEVDFIMCESFKGSPEEEDWIQSGGRDEDYDYYYEKWYRRVSRS